MAWRLDFIHGYNLSWMGGPHFGHPIHVKCLKMTKNGHMWVVFSTCKAEWPDQLMRCYKKSSKIALLIQHHMWSSNCIGNHFVDEIRNLFPNDSPELTGFNKVAIMDKMQAVTLSLETLSQLHLWFGIQTDGTGCTDNYLWSMNWRGIQWQVSKSESFYQTPWGLKGDFCSNLF